MQVPPPYPPPHTQPQRYVPPPQQKANRRLIAVVLLALLLLVVGGTVAVIMLAPTLGQALMREVNKPRSSGPSAPWPALLSAAQQEAARVDKDAVLDGITASPVQYQPTDWTYTNTLELTFRYIRPNGGELNVYLEDSAPTSTLRITQREHSDPESSREFYTRLKERQQERNTILASIKMTPRDAVKQTWEEAMLHAEQVQMDKSKLAPLVSLYSLDLYGDAEEPVTWHISYREPTLDIGKIFEQAISDFNYDVNAEDGTILKRGYENP
jgi:hypothetical protein